MPPEAPPTSAPTAAPGAAVLVEGYRVDSYEIPQQYARTLREYVGSLVRALRSRPGSSLVLTLVGHTDSTGSERHNTVLGLNRALGVERAMQTLTPQDVEAQVRYASGSGGEYAPVSANTTARDRARNRRVEVWGVLSLSSRRSQSPAAILCYASRTPSMNAIIMLSPRTGPETIPPTPSRGTTHA